jgi:flagellar hook-length control protein FliK
MSQNPAGQPAPATASARPANENLPSGASNSPSSPAATSELPPVATVGPVQVAQIASKAAQTEMRIGMNTSAFGSVEVRTTVHANDVGVVIGSEKGDLRSLMSNELPGIANTLQQQNLRLNQVSFQQGAAFSGNSFAGNSSGNGSQQRAFSSSQTGSYAGLSTEMVDDFPLMIESASGRSTSLSILA